MIPRRDYLDNTALHDEYFLQFSTPDFKSHIAGLFSPEELMASNNHYFNDIPLQRWDSAVLSGQVFLNNQAIKEAGDFYSLSVGVCIAKAVARVLKNRFLAIRN